MSEENQLGEAFGILLYYHYVPLGIGSNTDQLEVEAFMRQNCESLSLRGRVRVANDGINATLGGAMKDLKAHADAVASHPLLGAFSASHSGQSHNLRLSPSSSIDFKFALASAADPSSSISIEAKFDRLVVRRCAEVVTLGARALSSAPLAETAHHASPAEFHQLLTQGDCVLIDVRNLYETRVGSFDAPSVTTYRPPTRVFSEFPDWVDQHANELAGKRILMCCTGGVRCERASAYVKSKGAAFNDVHQLEGGIVRYLETFRDGGYFRGANFVFDSRCEKSLL